MKTLTLILSSLLIASQMQAYQSGPKVVVQNSILAKVNGNTISMMDVKKKMDVMFHQNYPQFENSPQARMQFYEISWRHVLMDLIDHELMVADALEKEIKLTDAEVRETMEERFGPNTMQTLDKIGLTHDEAWKMTRNEMIVQRMSWWFIHSKANVAVTPQDIKDAYRSYVEKNPAYTQWKYQVITLHQPEDAAKLHKHLSESGKDPLSIDLKAFNASLSKEFVAKTDELSDAHKKELLGLAPKTYSTPSTQTNRVDKKQICRIFYLIEANEHPAPSFEAMSAQLRNELNQKAIAQESSEYLTKLRKKYGFNPAAENAIPEDLHPFSLQ